MNLDRDPADIAAAAAEELRALNHKTSTTKELSAPEISRTVQNLITLLERLPQGLSQLSARLVAEQRNGRVRMEDDSNPARPVVEVDTHLTDAEADIDDVLVHLRKAGALLFAMGAPYDPTDDDEQGEEL